MALVLSAEILKNSMVKGMHFALEFIENLQLLLLLFKYETDYSDAATT